MSAIKLFHGEVSEDLLLKEREFDGLRSKLLRGAADFYGKMEGLLTGHTDPKSRAALATAYDELAGLSGNIGNKQDALAVYQKAIAVRRELAVAAVSGCGGDSRPGAQPACRGLLAARHRRPGRCDGGVPGGSGAGRAAR